MKRFAKTIVKVLVAYVNIVKEEFPKIVEDERIVSIALKSLKNLSSRYLILSGHKNLLKPGRPILSIG